MRLFQIETKSRKLFTGRLALILCILVVLFAPSLFIEFVSDNISHITEASDNLLDRSFQYFRPVTILTLILDHAVWGLNPLGFHLTNLVLHLLCVFLVAALVAELTGSRTAVLVSAAFFGVHPIHASSVFWISGRADIVCTGFFLYALLYFVKYTREGRTPHLLICLSLAAASILSKEMALSLPLVAAAFSFAIEDGNVWSRIARSIRRTWSLWIMAGVFVLFRLLTAGSSAIVSDVHSNLDPLHLLKNLATFVGLLVVPGGHITIGEHLQSHPELFQVLAAAGLVLMALTFRWAINHKWAMLYLLFMLLTMLPVLRLAQRWYLYLPSVGFCCLLGWLVARARESKTLKNWAGVAAVLVFAMYAGFLVREQTRWIAAGEMAQEFTDKLVNEIAKDQIEKAYVLTVPAELNQVPVLMHGFGDHVSHFLEMSKPGLGPTDLIPLTFVSLNDRSDMERIERIDLDVGGVHLSLAGTGSAFLFPGDADLISGRKQLQVGHTVKTADYYLVVDNVNAVSQATAVTVYQKKPDLPILDP